MRVAFARAAERARGEAVLPTTHILLFTHYFYSTFAQIMNPTLPSNSPKSRPQSTLLCRLQTRSQRHPGASPHPSHLLSPLLNTLPWRKPFALQDRHPLLPFRSSCRADRGLISLLQYSCPPVFLNQASNSSYVNSSTHLQPTPSLDPPSALPSASKMISSPRASFDGDSTEGRMTAGRQSYRGHSGQI